MKKFTFKFWVEKIRLGALRFPFTLFFLLGLSFLFFLQINKRNIDIHTHTWAFFSLGVVMSIAITLFSENFNNIITRAGLHLLGILILMIYCYTLPEIYLPVHIYQAITVGIVFTISSIFVPFFKKNNDIPFWEFNKTSILQLIISFIFAQIIMMGLSLAVLSMKELFKINVQPEVYQNLAVICYVLFAPVYFLSNIPDEIEKLKVEYTFPNFMKILGLYILLPILALYSLILYVYLIQIIVKWELPNGWVSWLVSILGLGGFLCMHILYPLRLENQNKVVKLLSNYFPVLLFPLLVLMTVGIFRRLDDYGLTINRLYVLILNIWLYGICIYLFLSKAKHLKWIIISFATVMLLSSIGPWSVFSITKRTLIREIGQSLNKAHLLKNGKVIDNSNFNIKIDSTLTTKLSGKINYTFKTYGGETLQPFFTDSIIKLKAEDINKKLGLENKFSITQTQYYNVSLTNNQVINIEKYKYFIQIRNANESGNIAFGTDFKIKFSNNTLLVSKPIDKQPFLTIPINPKLKEIILTNRKTGEYSQEELSIKGKDYVLIINNLNLFKHQRTDSVKITKIDANLFLK